jgi:hypothetical protein
VIVRTVALRISVSVGAGAWADAAGTMQIAEYTSNWMKSLVVIRILKAFFGSIKYDPRKQHEI